MGCAEALRTLVDTARVDARRIGWLWVTAQFILLAVLLFLPWQAHALPLLSTGGLIALAGGLLALSVSRTLGEAFTATPVPRAGAHLSRSGPYRYLRHPMYVGVLLIILGLLIAAGSPLGWLWGAVLVIFFWLKSRWEDARLHDAYGTDWEQWASATGAFWPRRGRGTAPHS